MNARNCEELLWRGVLSWFPGTRPESPTWAAFPGLRMGLALNHGPCFPREPRPSSSVTLSVHPQALPRRPSCRLTLCATPSEGSSLEPVGGGDGPAAALTPASPGARRLGQGGDGLGPAVGEEEESRGSG